MFDTSGDVLNMALAIGFIILVIFLCFLIFYAVLVLRDVSRTTGKVESIVERVHKTVIEPLKAIDYMIEKARPYIEAAVERKKSKKK